jgi:hypothetical protein
MTLPRKQYMPWSGRRLDLMVRNDMCRALFAQRKKYYRHQGPLMIVANGFILKFEPELKISQLHSLCGLSLARI